MRDKLASQIQAGGGKKVTRGNQRKEEKSLTATSAELRSALDGRGRPSPDDRNQRRRTGGSAPHLQSLTSLLTARRPALPLDVQILHVQRVVFDEFSAGFYVFAHQRSEDGLTLGYVFEADLQKRAALGIHGRFPELLGSHFSEAFVALDDVLSAAFVQDVIEEFAGSMFLDDLRLFRPYSERRLAGFLLRLLGFFFLGGA